jgi:hypothetical protein
MKTQLIRTAIFLCCLILAGPPLTGQQSPEYDPIGENLFPPELVLSNQKAIGLDDAPKDFRAVTGFESAAPIRGTPVSTSRLGGELGWTSEAKPGRRSPSPGTTGQNPEYRA